MTERLPPDQASRDAIRNDLDVTMLVEAAAGTGKTTNLVKRMVNLVVTERAAPAKIAAITFTVKASAHLREEFQQALERGGLAAALQEIDRGFIGTTHSFCARLLRERPVEAGLDPEFEELDEAAARAATSDFWNRWYDTRAVGGHELIEEAREVGLTRPILRGAFEAMVEHPDITLVSQRRARPDLRAVVSEVSAFLDECEPSLPTGSDHKRDDFEVLIIKLLNDRRASDLNDVFEQIAFLEEANHGSRKPTQKNWPDKAVAKQLGLDFKELVTDRIRPALREWREHVHGIALELLRPATEEFAADRRRNGTLTFQDLLVCARDLLRDHPNVRRYFQRRFTHVLVDEFQDTDPVQAEVLLYLTGEDIAERNWRKLRPRPGSLFIVGDPKQSIYRFRRADITTYLEVKEIIVRSGGKVVPLSTNFRSVPAICTFVNDAFKELFSADDVVAKMQAEHVDLSSFVDASSRSGVFTLESTSDRNDTVACAEAEAVGRWIRAAVDAGSLHWNDVLLVSWQRPRLSHYARCFERLGIPYDITGSNAFKGLDDLADAMPLLRAIVMPEDEVAVVAFLRGPLCGVDDDALYRFRMDGGRFSPFGDQPETLDPRIARGLVTIREAIDDARQHPPAAAIARLFDRIGLVALSAGGEQPGTRSGNLMLALSIARDLSSRGESLASIAGHLSDMLENPPEIEELDIDPSRVDAVRLMNLHQVKGLEAPVVFLIDPADEFNFPIDLVVDRSGEESLGHFALSKPWGKGKKEIALPVGWDEHKSREEGFKRAERMRLLYVAATRAKEMLIVGFRQTTKGVSGAWRELAGRIRDRLTLPVNVAARASSAGSVPGSIDIAARYEIAKKSSYSVLPVTKIAHANHEELVKAEEGLGKGMSWGRVLHRLFEAMLRNDAIDVRLYAANLLKDEERDPVELSEVMRVVEAVQSSDLWRRVKAADERYVEIPFALTIQHEEHGETLLHGTIDLVFREGERWFIVDYKSDSTLNRLEHLVAYYKPQVEHYARFWSDLTHAPATAGLFFVDGCIERWVS